jgi:bifunctional DNase/RNase
MEKKDDAIELEIIGMQQNPTIKDNYILVMGDKAGNWRLPIGIGTYEAQSIAIVIEQMTPERPLTHDVFVLLGNQLSFKVTKTVITELVEGVFLSTIFVTQGENNVTVSLRTSDAIAIAIRFLAPIFTTEAVLQAAGQKIENVAKEATAATQTKAEPSLSIWQKLKNRILK